MNKQIDHILKGRNKSIGEETILQSLPHKDFRFANPFIVLHHLPAKHFEPGSPPERLHPHPHRGFAPVTFMFSGEGFHKDSQGNSGVLKGGEVQWMFAGSGLLHSEGPAKEFLKRGGDYEFVQLWVNVPAEHKMSPPFYRQASREQMPAISEDGGIDLRLASGHYNNLSGPIQSFTPVTAIFGTMQQGRSIHLTANEGYWTLLYVLDGELSINDEKQIASQHLAVFNKAGRDISITAKANTKLLYLSAEPINEPVAAKGNFVMNTQEEVVQAEQDFAEGKFGVLDF